MDEPDTEAAHDVLAAEAFAVGGGDSALHPDPPHDVLAAEEFALGAGDPVLHQHRSEPEGPAHNVLAAEEFPVPTAASHGAREPWREHGAPGFVLATALVLAALVLRRRRRRLGAVMLGTPNLHVSAVDRSGSHP